MKSSPFELPLDAAQFSSALQKGQGRVILHARQYGLADFENVIIEACLHDQSYDLQCEPDRTDWILEVVATSGIESQIIQKLIPQLDAPLESISGTSHRCRIARRLAQRGYEETRRSVYSYFRKEGSDFWDIGGIEDIILLDKTDGLRYVAEQLGSFIQSDPNFKAADWPVRIFDEDQKNEGEGRRILETAALFSPAIAVYLRHIDDNKKAEANSDMPITASTSTVNMNPSEAARKARTEKLKTSSTADVIQLIECEDQSTNRPWFKGWGRQASKESLIVVFEAMLQEQEVSRLCTYLRIFIGGILTEFDARMLQYSDHSDPAVRRLANLAISNYSHPDVRRLALEQLKNSHWQDDQLELLKRNYQLGDAKIVEALLHAPEDRDKLHGLVLNLVRLFDVNHVVESANCLYFVYEESPCSLCREGAVKNLMEIGTIPDWLREECRYDSSEEIRKLVEEGKKE